MTNKKWIILLSIALFLIASSSTPLPTNSTLPLYQVAPDDDPLQAPKSPALLSSTAQQSNGTWVQILRSVGQVVIGKTIFVTDYATGNVFQYSGTPNNWIQVGTPARMLAYDATHERLYALSPDGGSVWKYAWEPNKWIQVGNAASAIYAGQAGLFAIDPTTGDIWHYNDEPFNWTRIGGPGKFFIPNKNFEDVLSVSPDGSQIWGWYMDDPKWQLMKTAPAQCTITALFGLSPQDGTSVIICNGTEFYKIDMALRTYYEWVPMGSVMEFKSIAHGDSGTIGLDINNNVLQWEADSGKWNYIGDNFEAIYGEDFRYPVCAREWGNHDLWCYYINE